jgi:hypothetical protein
VTSGLKVPLKMYCVQASFLCGDRMVRSESSIKDQDYVLVRDCLEFRWVSREAAVINIGKMMVESPSLRSVV